MSLTYRCEAPRDDLVEFLLDEHRKGTGIPVHPYSVVNATFEFFNKSLAITDSDGKGVVFLEDTHQFKSYGCGDPLPLLRALNRCNAGISILN